MGSFAATAPMLSYAQNAEDVVLRRVFADVESGFYVDVGASSPFDDSVTMHFYEHGWSGVNVEPDPREFAELVAARPRDVNLHAAVGSGDGPLRFSASETRGHGTVAESGGGIDVTQISLEEIFSTYVPESDVSFLKVDVEGWEAEVLASTEFERVRPQVVLVEAVDAAGSPTHDGWEPHLLDAGYRFGLFDGVNRFYCRKEDAERLLPRLAAPANVFDNWRFEREVRVQTRLIEERAQADAICANCVAALQADLDRLADAHARAASDAEAGRQELDRARRQEAVLAAKLAAVEASTSWRSTAKLRDASRFLKLLRREPEA